MKMLILNPTYCRIHGNHVSRMWCPTLGIINHNNNKSMTYFWAACYRSCFQVCVWWRLAYIWQTFHHALWCYSIHYLISETLYTTYCTPHSKTDIVHACCACVHPTLHLAGMYHIRDGIFALLTQWAGGEWYWWHVGTCEVTNIEN